MAKKNQRNITIGLKYVTFNKLDHNLKLITTYQQINEDPCTGIKILDIKNLFCQVSFSNTEIDPKSATI